MYPLITDQTSQQAAEHLARHDRRLAPIIAQAGPCPLRAHTDYYYQLVRSVIGQQLSVRAAATITQRFLELFDSHLPTPAQILALSDDQLRAVGFSRAKVGYVKDLANRLLDGRLAFDRLDELSNQTIIAELTAVKGIGVWTAHMFLIFSMARSDILPTGDLGIRAGMQKLYGLTELPSPTTMLDLAQINSWQPYQSVASWYVWRSLDNAPA